LARFPVLFVVLDSWIFFFFLTRVGSRFIRPRRDFRDPRALRFFMVSQDRVVLLSFRLFLTELAFLGSRQAGFFSLFSAFLFSFGETHGRWVIFCRLFGTTCPSRGRRLVVHFGVLFICRHAFLISYPLLRFCVKLLIGFPTFLRD